MICDDKAQRIGAKTIEHVISHKTDLGYVTLEKNGLLFDRTLLGANCV
jgi:hypothetical protein